MGVKIKNKKFTIEVLKSKNIKKINIITKPYPGFPTDLQAQLMVLMTRAQGVSKIKENEMYNYFFSFYKKNLYVKSKMYVGLNSFLKKLKKRNYKLAVCSNKLEELTKIVLKKSKLFKYFDFIAGGDTFAHRKPHPSVLNNVIKKFKINKDKTLFIGDSEHDYHSALNSNIKFCLKTKGFTNKPESFFKKSFKIKNYTDKNIDLKSHG